MILLAASAAKSMKRNAASQPEIASNNLAYVRVKRDNIHELQQFMSFK